MKTSPGLLDATTNLALQRVSSCKAEKSSGCLNLCIAIARTFLAKGPVPGIDIDLPEPEKVANAFGDNNLKVRRNPPEEGCAAHRLLLTNRGRVPEAYLTGVLRLP